MEPVSDYIRLYQLILYMITRMPVGGTGRSGSQFTTKNCLYPFKKSLVMNYSDQKAFL